MPDRVLRIGVSGLGRAFLLTAPALIGDPRVAVVAAADPRPDARARFQTDFGGRAYAAFQDLCSDPDVDLIYIAAPHGLHAPQAIEAARAGKHVLVEKPMALSLADCEAMIEAAASAGVRLMVGPSHGFDAPIALARSLIATGEFGAPRMVTALNYTDFLYRPRHAEELDTAAGGGVVFNQAPHQVDIVRSLVASPVRSVRASTGVWDPDRPTEGAYNALLSFESGASASLIYSGYDRFDSDELLGWISELGRPKNPYSSGGTRRRLLEQGRPEEVRRSDRTYGPTGLSTTEAGLHEHFGLVIVSCERADLRTTPRGVIVHADGGRTLHEASVRFTTRAELVDELVDVLVEGRAPVHSGDWGMASLEVCLAMLRSSAEGREITLVGKEGRGG